MPHPLSKTWEAASISASEAAMSASDAVDAASVATPSVAAGIALSADLMCVFFGLLVCYFVSVACGLRCHVRDDDGFVCEHSPSHGRSTGERTRAK